MKKRIVTLCVVIMANLWAIGNLTLVYNNANIKELRGVFAFMDGPAWAVGTDGTVLRSSYGGPDWQPIDIAGAQDYHLNGIYFANTNIGCIVGEKKADPHRFKGIIYRTTNGGASWDELPGGNYISEKYVPFKDVAFDIGDYGNPASGYIAAGEGWIYNTNDYGETWTRELVDQSKLHCFQGVGIDWLNGTAYAAGDASNSTGIFATLTTSGWQVEYPCADLSLNFFDVTETNGSQYVAASKGYLVYKDWYTQQWATSHQLPDQQVIYAIAPFVDFISMNMFGGSDETIRKGYSGFGAEHNWRENCIKGVSPSAAWGQNILSRSTYFVGTNGRIWHYDHDWDPWPPGMYVYGEYQRVRCDIWDSEEPLNVYIYRSTCPEGPYDLVDNFTVPASTWYTWYDTDVGFNVDYYYRINGLPAYNNPAHPSGLPDPSFPPQPPQWFTAEDYPNDNGAVVSLHWPDEIDPDFTLYRDGIFLRATTLSQFTDSSAITGKAHSYQIRKRRYYTPQNDYIYSAPVTSICTPINDVIPSAPTSLTGERISSTEIKIRWNEPADIDIAGYYIYRRINGGAYTKLNPVPVPRAFWCDSPFNWARAWYKVTAVDWSSNESDYSNEKYFKNQNVDPDNLQGNIQGNESQITKTTLNRITPNPVIDNASVYFDLAQEDFVQIEIYDVLGRMAKSLFTGNLAAGTHRINLISENNPCLSNGVYFLKMNASNYQAVEKFIIRR
jgi:hypothetical protein